MATVSAHQTNPFPSPVRSTQPVDANVVRGNDNLLRLALNAHDANATIHVQSSDLGNRPAFGVEGRVWVTPYGADEFEVWYDDGTQWRAFHNHDPYAVQQINTSTTLVLDHVHTLVVVDTTAGSVTLTLPTAASAIGHRVDIKKVTSAHTLTVDADGAETIDGAATLSWTTLHESNAIISDGTQWWVTT